MKKVLCLLWVLLTLPTICHAAPMISFPDALGRNNFVLFGTFNKKPITWQMAQDTTEDAPLAVSTFVLCDKAFDEAGDADYENSTLRAYLDGEFLKTAFTEREMTLLSDGKWDETGIEHWLLPSPLTAGDRFFVYPPSLEEYRQFLLPYLATATYLGDTAPAAYALRNLHQTDAHLFGVMDQNGNVMHRQKTDSVGIRPAIRLLSDRILFIRKSIDDEVPPVGTLEKTDFNRSGEWKLCIKDDTLKIAADPVIMDKEGRIGITYHDAQYQKNTYLSAVVTDPSGKIVGYGRIKKITSPKGYATAKTPFLLEPNGYRLLIFLEQPHKDGETDYAGTPIALSAVDGTVAPVSNVPIGRIVLSLLAAAAFLAGLYTVTHRKKHQ